MSWAAGICPFKPNKWLVHIIYTPQADSMNAIVTWSTTVVVQMFVILIILIPHSPRHR